MAKHARVKAVAKLKKALHTLYDEDKHGQRANIIDALTDLRHYCDRLELCFGDLDRMAYQHYTIERRREGA